MNNITVFNNPEFGQIRTVEVEGEPWFVAADVCRALEISDTHKAVDRLDDDEKGRSLIPTPGGAQQMAIVNEPGLYSLVLGSRKPEAKAFKRWVTHEVLPALRKTGKYSTSKATGPSMDDKMVVVEAAARMLNMNESSKILMLQNFCKQEGIENTFLPSYENNGGRQLISASTLLKEYNLNLPIRQFNKAMLEHGFLEERERKSSRNITKRFKALTEKGLTYGENQISPQNPREVQPLYYKDSFKELFDLVTCA